MFKKSKSSYTKPSYVKKDYSVLRTKLGLRTNAPKDKIKYTLECLRSGNPKTWKEKGITSSDFDEFGIKGYNK